MSAHEKLNYVEFPASDFVKTRRFFSEVFDWSFTDYGDDYMAFSNAGMEGGFFRADQSSKTENGGALLVFYSEDLEYTAAKLVNAGGEIIRPTFSFPGGRRFHFVEPSGNEFAVWSDKGC